MRRAEVIWAVSCAVAVATGCSSSSNGAATDSGSDAASPGSDDSTTPGGDDGNLGPPMGMMEASITCKGAVDCGGAGHSCCYSTATNATSCVTGGCGMNYTQCVSSDSECPTGYQCIQSPLGADIHYCARGGDGGGGTGEGGTAEASTEAGGADAGSTDSGGDGPTE